MTGSEIIAFLDTAGIRPEERIIPRDKNYRHPTRRWFLGPCAKAFARNNWAEGLRTYRKQANDCDDFATRLAQMARDCHAITAGSEGTGLAVGALWYTPDGQEDASMPVNHLVAFAIVYDLHPDGPPTPALVVMEPQTGREITLSSHERWSVFKVDV